MGAKKYVPKKKICQVFFKSGPEVTSKKCVWVCGHWHQLPTAIAPASAHTRRWVSPAHLCACLGPQLWLIFIVT